MIKKTLLYTFVLVLSMVLSACGEQNSQIKESTTPDIGKNIKNNDIKGSDVADIEEKPEENAFVEFMESDEFANPVNQDGEFANPYAFYDINQDGIDELIIIDGYFNYQIFGWFNNSVELIANNKYGSKLRIYPESHCFYWTGGHKDNYYEEYYVVKKNGKSVVATKTWKINPATGKTLKVVYKIKGKKCKKATYKSKIKKYKTKEVINSKKLSWINLKLEDQILD